MLFSRAQHRFEPLDAQRFRKLARIYARHLQERAPQCRLRGPERPWPMLPNDNALSEDSARWPAARCTSATETGNFIRAAAQARPVTLLLCFLPGAEESDVAAAAAAAPGMTAGQ